MRRALVVEDSRTQAQALALLFESEGFAVDVATDGPSGLKRCCNAPYDVVLSDVVMPGFDGYELCRRIKSDDRTRHVPVVLLTSLAEPLDIIQGLECGADNFITKPYEPTDLLARVNELLDNRDMRAKSKVAVGVELLLRGRRFLINAEKEQILDLLIATFEEIARSQQREREAREAAEAASRAKSAFLANLSHEIRTPMNAIIGYTQLLQRHPNLDSDQRKCLEVIGRSGEHLLGLLNDVLEMSRIEAGQRKVQKGPVDLQAMLADLEHMLRLRADNKRLAFEILAAPEVPRYVVSDEGKLRQVLLNLLGNAIKFTERGSVIVRVHAPWDERGSLRLVAEVEDTGPGIAPDELSALFQPFAQARAGIASRTGTGLGLALSREFARLMGGDITVRSTLGNGSVFRLDLPVEIGEPPALAPATPTSGRILGIAGEGASPRVLVVDDDEDGRTWVSRLLVQVGFDVREAKDGAEALRVFDAWQPRAVLMDMHMPVMDGFSAMRALRARPSGEATTIVAVTASAFEDVHASILAAGADGCLRKPCRETELLDELGKHLGVEYVIAAPPSRAASSSSPDPMGEPNLRALPRECAVALRDAARAADYDRLLELIRDLPPEHSSAAQLLARLADAFAYDEIGAELGD